MKKIAIIGAGGFGQEVYCIWRDQLEHEGVEYEFVGFYDDADDLYENRFGKVLGKVDALNHVDYPLEVAIAIGSPQLIYQIKNRLNNPNLIFPNIIHPSVQFLGKESIHLGEGNILSLNVIFSCNTTIGNFNIFNTRATLGHDDIVGDYNVFSPNVQISGAVIIEDLNLFGFSCGVIQKKKIGNRNILGAGAILLRTIKDEGTYIGIPAVKMKI
ncbi:serine acetyltransferase [Chryseobacterium jejuense]|uniref:PglD-related sugar-binding protein n=1 Tax=Chryseobacterium jejuense TaxID=445960 RepID=UPI001AE124F6|nr:serine acetyltransferase [Chryseobacterium jejuense]MBP2618039.1 sugar O-acyltransferase (sialic acid O-acetyltransferase NeuD family) [Chryseobacterium jejuense]